MEISFSARRRGLRTKCLNRTIVEWKSHNLVTTKRYPRGLNRTIVEWKSVQDNGECRDRFPNPRLNRTIVEWKLPTILQVVLSIPGLNRTIVEWKSGNSVPCHSFNSFNVSIEPLWNGNLTVNSTKSPSETISVSIEP